MVTFKNRNASELVNVLSLHKTLCQFLTRCIDGLMELCVELSETARVTPFYDVLLHLAGNVKVESVYCQTFQNFFLPILNL